MAYSTNEPVPVTHGVMRPSRKSLLPFALLAGALWTGGTGLHAQTPVNLTVSATTPPPYVADQTITTDTGNPLIVNSGVSVTFQAGSQIVLAPGFHAMAGSTFTALIAFPTLTIVSPASLPAATAGIAYAGASVVASGGSGLYTWWASGLPNGLSIGVYTGIIAGTPASNSGSPFNVQVTVTDSNSVTVSRNYTLVVSPPLSITAPSSLPEGTVGSAFPSTTAIATGGSGTYTWSQTGLPAGLSIGSASGAITGTPTASTASPVTVQLTATDSNGVAASRNFTFAVNPAMSITGPASLPSGTVNSAYSSTSVTASGGTGSYTWSATGLPPGLSIVSGGVIQGTPNTSAGSPYSVQVTASDSNMATASSTFNLAVSSGQDFGLTLNYSYAPVSFTSSISIPIPTTCVNGFSGNISFNGFNFTSGSGELPAYYPPGMSSVTVPCGSSGTMTLNMYSNNPPGPPHTYQVTVQAQATIDGQTVVHSQTYGVNLTADPASGMVATPYAQTVVAGGPPAFFSVGFPTANAFGGTVALSCSTSSQLPCSEVGLSPASLYNPLGLTSTMTVTVPAGTAPGVYSISVLGTVSGQQQQVSTSVQVTVAGPVDSGFTLSASPVWQQVAAGGSATYAITANPNNGFTGDITLSCVGLPPGVTAGVSPNPITASAGYSGMLTLSVDPSVASGTATCTLIGTSGSVASQVLANAQIVNSPAQSEGITITTSPAGLSLIIDASTTQPGTPCTSPCVFQWVASSTHNISAPSTQGTGGTQYVFSSWSDSQPQTHQIIASSSATYTASFITQYYLSMTATNGGAVTPSSGYYNSGQTVTVTAPSTASNGAIFTGFSGAISGMSLQQTMVLAGPEGVVANFTAVPSSVPITALPASETVAPGGTTTFSVVVNNAAGLGGAANLAISGVPQGSTASFSPASLGGPGTSTLSVAVASNTALGTYPLTITASNGTSTATTMATLTVTSPVPANMISPASGSSLSAGPVTFAWDSGLGVSQYQFVLGTQPGKSDLYNGAAGTSQSASFTLEASGPSAYGQLSSMVAGVWQPPIQYSYKLNQTSPQSVTASGIGYSNNADWVDAGGPASQPWTYCVVPAGSSCSNTTLSAAYISNCQVDAFVSAKILAEGYASSTEQPNAFDVTFTASASAPPGPRSLSCLYSPPSSAGLTLKLKNALTVDSAPPYIASIIQETQAYPGAPFYVYLYGKHFGSQPGWVNVCLRAGGIFIPPCQATTDLTVTPPYLVWSDNEVELELTPTTTTPGQYDLMVSAQFTADGASVEDDPTGQGSNRATVLVNQPLTISGTVTLGTSGKPIPGVSVTLADGNNKFLALTRSAANGTYSFSVSAGGTYEVRTSQIGYYFTPASSLYQNLAQSVTNANFVAKPLTTIYLIHGIGQGSAAMASLAANLTNPANGLDLTRFQVDAGFDFSQCAANPSCSNSCSIGAGGQSLAQYISSNPPPGPIILIGYSMGGLIARDMISNAFYGQSAPTVAGLITLGTPHLGYPFDPVDQLAFCPTLVFQMNGGWPAATQNEFLSAYLTSLIGSQSFKSTMASNGAYWMAAAGRHCSIPTRLTPSTNGNGCLVSSPRSDCIVCNDSALYTGSIPQSQNDITPIAPWTDTQKIYVHTNSVGGWGSSFIFGSTTPAVDQQLFDPLTTGTLFSAIVNFINGN